jgi:hypothetical protein
MSRWVCVRHTAHFVHPARQPAIILMQKASVFSLGGCQRIIGIGRPIATPAKGMDPHGNPVSEIFCNPECCIRRSVIDNYTFDVVIGLVCNRG